MSKSFIVRADKGVLRCLDCDFNLPTGAGTLLTSLKRTARRHKDKTGHSVVITYQNTWHI